MTMRVMRKKAVPRSPSINQLLYLCLAGYLLWTGVVGHFSASDEVYFKAAGREWAETGRFGAPELTGFLDGATPSVEEVFAVYTPLYSFLFGIVVKLFGLGFRQVWLFDGTIHALLALLTFTLIRRLSVSVPAWAAFSASMLILPLGTRGRPDELGMCFGIGASILLLGRGSLSFKSIPAGILLGLSAASSPGASLVYGTIAFSVVVTSGRKLSSIISILLSIGFFAALSLLGSLAPIIVSYPDAYLNQFFGVASSYAFNTGYVQLLKQMWIYGKYTLITVGSTLLSGLFLFRLRSAHGWRRRWLNLWVGPACGLLLVLWVMPGKHTYVWFAGPWLIAVAAVTLFESKGMASPWQRIAASSILMMGLVLGSVPAVFFQYAKLTLPQDQTLKYNVEIIDRLIPSGSAVLTSEYWPLLGSRCRVYDASEFTRPKAWERLDYIVLTGHGTGVPGKMRMPLPEIQPYIEEQFREVHSNLASRQVSLFGMRLSNSAYGYGAVILKRKKSEL